MHKFLLLFYCNLFACLLVQGQSVSIQGQFTYTEGFEQVRFVGFRDSVQVLAQSPLKEGGFALEVQNLQPGIYRLQYGPNPAEHYIDVIIATNDKAITLAMDLREEVKEPQFTGSVMNQKLQEYLKKQKELVKQLRFQYQTYHSAPVKNQKAAQLSKKEFTKTYKQLQQLEQNFLKENKDNLAGLYVQARQVWLPTLATEPKTVYQKKYETYWEKLPISQEAMQNTPFYNTFLMEYLGYYFNQRLEPIPWEAQMKQALATVMQYMSQTPYTQKLALQYLLENMKAIGHEGLLQFLDENYAQTAQCLEPSLQEDVAFRLKSYEVGKAGQEIPNVTLTSKQDLHGLIKEKTLLVFWSSSCPHCMEEWEKLEKWSAKNPAFQIIAISLDTDKKVYEEALSKLPKNVQYFCDFKGWDSEAMQKYYIMATPTLFEIDKDKKFVKKGKVLEQFGNVE
jgi:thiol-disulfide isomerase/thioredoxin